MADQAPGSEVVATRLAEVLFIQALRAHIASGAGWRNEEWLRAIFDPQIGTALRAIHDRINTPWTVVSLAAVAGCLARISRHALKSYSPKHHWIM